MAFAKTSVPYWDELLIEDLLPKPHILTPGKREDIREPLFVGQISGLCQQLASVVGAAEEMFRDLSQSLDAMDQRITNIAGALVRTEEDVSNVRQRNLGMGKSDPLSFVRNRGVETERAEAITLQADLSHESMPPSLIAKYNACSSHPDFSEINRLLDNEIADTKYSDPTFFFNNWRETEMRKAEKEKAERKQKRKKRKAAKDKEGKEEKKTVARFTKKEYSAHGAELAGLQLKTSSAGKVLVDTDEVNFIPADPVLPLFVIEGESTVHMPQAPAEKLETTPAVVTKNLPGSGRAAAVPPVPETAPPPPPANVPAFTPEPSSGPSTAPPPPTTSAAVDVKPPPMSPPSAAAPPPPPPPSSASSPPPPPPPPLASTSAPPPITTSTPAPPPPPPPVTSAAPPPPPPPPAAAAAPPPPPPPPMQSTSSAAPAPPPLAAAPPPPPPAPSMSGGGSPSSLLSEIQAGRRLRKVSVGKAKPSQPVDARSNLLEDIRKGRQLRKVDKESLQASSPAAKAQSGGSNVANILAKTMSLRRGALEGADSDSESEGSEWDDDE